MRAESYVTLHRGLLTAAVYDPRDPARRAEVRAGWTVPAALLLRDAVIPGQTTLTSVSPSSRLAGDDLLASGSRTSATSVCRYRRSLQT